MSADRLQRREGHPLGARRVYEDPADEAAASGAGRRWTFGIAAGALLVAGTVAAGAFGLNGDALPSGAEGAPEHAPSAPGNGPHDGGSPAAAGDQSDKNDKRETARPTKPASAGPRVTVPVQHAPQADEADNGGHATGESRSGDGENVRPAPAPAPAPAPDPAPGPVEQVVTPVTDTVSDVVTPVTDTVGDILSPVTGILSGGGDQQPALTMIDPLGGLLGG
ncbi:MAG: hypothetical protein GEV28_28620 [Actinophytocola sp.]|uniref:hypothetical protein n=1 Tax=Actinophytocola sp. TaxID=1872138 RepID=UPI001321DD23|nr:hypothetical protein [Actinophytocola sp.]MPZ84149.1 hypothetical protein [Actinophytocola sp.]